MSFWQLENHDDRIAVITEQSQLSYAELKQQADGLAARLPGNKSLGIVCCKNNPRTLVAYLACLRSGHAVILVSADMPRQSLDQLIKAYQIDWLVDASGELQVINSGVNPVSEQVALLLSTSGSTGSPKQVVLSADNLASNADSIAHYLDIKANDRAITSLPFQYTYGLSVINSHLSQGAALLMTDESVMTRGFWDLFRTHKATSLAGVPTTYEMLRHLKIESMQLSSLRTLTQAGGRLPTQSVQYFEQLAVQNGWDFYVMYGQTEATARMAYMKPEQVRLYPDCIGQAIPGGELWLEDETGKKVTKPGKQGELVYRGPNVMQGYACTRQDLWNLMKNDVLHTGDLAELNKAGLIKITGRKKRLVKINGIRLSLDELETLFHSQGLDVKCTGTDDNLVIGYLSSTDKGRIQSVIEQFTQLKPQQVKYAKHDNWPMTESGKLAYEKLAFST